MQQKAQPPNQTAKKPNKINDVDELDGNDINRVPELFVDDLPIHDDGPKQGEYLYSFFNELFLDINNHSIFLPALINPAFHISPTTFVRKI